MNTFTPYSYPGLLISESQRDITTVEYIKTKVCSVYRTTFERVDKKSRKRRHVIVRQAIMYFLRTYTSLTLEDIVEIFTYYKDHSTILHGIKEYGNVYKQDPKTLKNHNVIDKRIKEFIK